MGLHEALVHNGDFANYASICAHLAQRNRFPHFLTDTEVAALLFDLLYRTYGYPLEYVIEALAPTTERDFALLPAEKREIIRLLQANHLRGSPDGPWYFLIAQSAQRERELRLIGITDTSMLRPQVFALQQGEASVGVAASEKQAVDALLESLAAEDARFWPACRPLLERAWRQPYRWRRLRLRRATVRWRRHARRARQVREGHRGRPGPPAAAANGHGSGIVSGGFLPDGSADEVVARVLGELRDGHAEGLRGSLAAVVASADGSDAYRERAFAVLAALLDRRYPVGGLKRSSVLALVDAAVEQVSDAIRLRPSAGFGRRRGRTRGRA